MCSCGMDLIALTLCSEQHQCSSQQNQSLTLQTKAPFYLCACQYCQTKVGLASCLLHSGGGCTSTKNFSIPFVYTYIIP